MISPCRNTRRRRQSNPYDNGRKAISVRFFIAALIITLGMGAHAAMTIPTDLKAPVEDGIWLRPSTTGPADPVIGFKDGIRIGLWPAADGPRGIIRIYAPYVFPAGKQRPLINYIAIEPIVSGHRSHSELEHSALDSAHGKRLWFASEVEQTPKQKLPWECVAGKTGTIRAGNREIRTLSIVINIEKLDNGAQPAIVASFREDRPNEVTFRVYATKESAAMQSCVLTSTMGNYSRARLLWLKDEVVDSRKIWPGYTGSDFVSTPDYAMDKILKGKDGTLAVAITPSETDLPAAQVERKWWYFDGRVATQFWRKYADTVKSPVAVRVNGRAVYYGTNAPLPGGIAFENFELIEKYQPGVESVFGVTLQTPAQMGWKQDR